MNNICNESEQAIQDFFRRFSRRGPVCELGGNCHVHLHFHFTWDVVGGVRGARAPARAEIDGAGGPDVREAAGHGIVETALTSVMLARLDRVES